MLKNELLPIIYWLILQKEKNYPLDDITDLLFTYPLYLNIRLISARTCNLITILFASILIFSWLFFLYNITYDATYSYINLLIFIYFYINFYINFIKI